MTCFAKNTSHREVLERLKMKVPEFKISTEKIFNLSIYDSFVYSFTIFVLNQRSFIFTCIK